MNIEILPITLNINAPIHLYALERFASALGRIGLGIVAVRTVPDFLRKGEISIESDRRDLPNMEVLLTGGSPAGPPSTMPVCPQHSLGRPQPLQPQSHPLGRPQPLQSQPQALGRPDTSQAHTTSTDTCMTTRKAR
jgi:hypothetical protein